MANLVQELLLKVSGDSSGGQQAAADLAASMVQVQAKLSLAQEAASRAKGELTDLASAMSDASGKSRDSLQPELENSAQKFQEAQQKANALKAELKELQDVNAQTGQSFSQATAGGNDFDGMVTRVLERLAVYASVRGVLGAVSSTIQFGLELERLKAQTDFSVEGLQRLEYASAQTGVPMTSLTMAITQLQRKLELEDGGAIAALNRLGIAYDDIRAKSPEEQFAMVAEKLGQVKDQTEFAGDASQLFSSRSGAAIAAVIRQYDDLKEKANEANVVLSSDQVDAIASVAHAWETAKMKAEAYFASILAHPIQAYDRGGVSGLTVDTAARGAAFVAGGIPEVGGALSYGIQALNGAYLGPSPAQQLAEINQKLTAPVLPGGGPGRPSSDGIGIQTRSRFTANADGTFSQTGEMFGQDKQGTELMREADVAAQRLTQSAKELEAQNKKNATAQQKINDLNAAAASSYRDLSGAQIEAIRYYQQQNLTVEQIGKELALYPNQVRGAIEADKQLAAQKKELQKVEGVDQVDSMLGVQKLAKQQSQDEIASLKTNNVIIEGMRQQAADAEAQLVDTTFEHQRAKLEEWQNEQEGALDYSVGSWTTAYASIQKVVDDKLTLIEQSENEAQQKRVDSAKAAHDAVMTTPGGLIGSLLSDVPSFVQQAATGGGGMSGALQGLVSKGGESLFGSLFGKTSSSAGSVVTPGTGLAGWLEGVLPDSLAKAIPFIGPAIGALMGPIVEGFKKLFTGRTPAEDVIRGAGYNYGVTLTQQMAQGIADQAATLHISTQAATILSASQLFPTVDNTNFSKAVQITHDAFAMIATGQLSVAQGAQTLDDMWPKLAAAGTDAYGRISDSLKELIVLNDQYGTHSKAIADFLKTQASNAASGLGAIVASQQPVFDDYDKIGQAVTDAQKKIDDLTQSGQTGTAAWRKATDDLTKALADQKTAAAGASDSLNVLATNALTAFNAAIASGQSFSQALAGVAPSLDKINKGFKDLGLQADNPIVKGLLLQNSIADANPNLAAGIAGLGQLVVAAQNIPGLMTPDTFAALEAQAGGLYVQNQGVTVAQGGTTANALLPFQDFLHEAQDYADKTKTQLDPVVQQMIDQSKETGVWSDKVKSSSDTLNDTMGTLIKSVDHLASVLGGGAPSPPGGGGSGGGDGGAGGDSGGSPGPSTPTGPIPSDGGGVPSLATGAFVRHPTLAMVGDAVGGEFVLAPGTINQWMATAMQSAFSRPPTNGFSLPKPITDALLSRVTAPYAAMRMPTLPPGTGDLHVHVEGVSISAIDSRDVSAFVNSGAFTSAIEQQLRGGALKIAVEAVARKVAA